MNIAFRAAGYGLLAAAVSAGIMYQAEQFNYSEEGHLVELKTPNDTMNKNGSDWYDRFPVKNGVMNVTDGSGTEFFNIPSGTKQADIIKHFSAKPQYKNHNFFNQKYQYSDDTSGCMPWGEYLTRHQSDINSYNFNLEFNDYVSSCAWATTSDMSFDIKSSTELKQAFYDKTEDLTPWGIGLGILAMLPGLWVGFWRLLGMAYRSAKKSAKGDY